jgi:hypothetical protein
VLPPSSEDYELHEGVSLKGVTTTGKAEEAYVWVGDKR